MLSSRNKDILLLTWQKLKSEHQIFITLAFILGISEMLTHHYSFSTRHEILLHPAIFAYSCTQRALSLDVVGWMVGALFMSTDEQSFESSLKKRNWKMLTFSTIVTTLGLMVLKVASASNIAKKQIVINISPTVFSYFLLLVIIFLPIALLFAFNSVSAFKSSRNSTSGSITDVVAVAVVIKRNYRLFLFSFALAILLTTVVESLVIIGAPSLISFSIATIIVITLVSVFMAVIAYDAGSRPKNKAKVKSLSTSSAFSL
ncbi:hypothetical protein [Photobacterium kishitanii]|uniref:Uncharacterized protein n=1 Tax=Photobacterium kishitanii TaxID=318456 RepID=A0A2T3KKZ0_9GAMM|nr:hypothetical protein [Photobacterium kishitanii]PSV00388.1 hypothetical protein C9J27_04470 [Photobacterium kishitanii]